MNELATTVLWLTSLILPALIFFAGGISLTILANFIRAILAIGFGWLFIVAYAQAAQFLSLQPINGAALAFASVLGWILPSVIVSICVLVRWFLIRRQSYKNAAKVKTDSRAIVVEIDTDSLHVTLADGRIVSAPLEWFPRLRDSSPAQQANWRFIGPGIGIHWEDIDEDISVRSLLVAEI